MDDFLLLDRGESLCDEREDASFGKERSERSDRSERGDDDRPRLLLLRVGLAEPLWRRFLSTAGDKYLSDKKTRELMFCPAHFDHRDYSVTRYSPPVLPGRRVLLLFFHFFQACVSSFLFSFLPFFLPL